MAGSPPPRGRARPPRSTQGGPKIKVSTLPLFSLHFSVDPRKIDNPTLRSLFESAVGLGDEVAAKAEKLVKTVREAK